MACRFSDLRSFHPCVALLLLSACASAGTYIAPLAAPAPRNAVSVPVRKSEVWRRLVPRLAQQFFVINNVDEPSGLINVSYSGDPERYVDCGSMIFDGQQVPAARARVHRQTALATVDRTLSLEGRANIIVQELSADSTRVSVTVRYVLASTVEGQALGQATRDDSQTISFDTGGRATFRQGAVCQPNGRFEADVIALVSP